MSYAAIKLYWGQLGSDATATHVQLIVLGRTSDVATTGPYIDARAHGSSGRQVVSELTEWVTSEVRHVRQVSQLYWISG